MIELVQDIDFHRKCSDYLDKNFDSLERSDPGGDKFYYQERAWNHICNYADLKGKNPIILLFQEWIYKNKYRNFDIRIPTRERDLALDFYSMDTTTLWDTIKRDKFIVPITWKFDNLGTYPFSLFFLGQRIDNWRILLQECMDKFPREAKTNLPWFYITSGVQHGLAKQVLRGLTREDY